MEKEPCIPRVGSTVDDAQQSSGESEKLKETVETKVDQMSGQTHNLERERRKKEVITGKKRNTEVYDVRGGGRQRQTSYVSLFFSSL